MWHEHSGLDPCIGALAQDITRQIQAHLQQAEVCSVALCGGRSPIPLFQRLAQADLEWSRVRLRLVDERYVPPDHPDSNERLVREHLLVGKAAAADFRGLYVPGASIDVAVDQANADADGQPFHLAVLGMGDDGHTASLFPGAAQLESALAREAACYLHVTPPEASHERITMSLAALFSTQRLLLYISGTQKRRVFETADQGATRRLPISYLLAEPGVSLDVHWHA